MDEIARTLFYLSISLYFIGFAHLCFQKDNTVKSTPLAILLSALAVHSLSIVLYATIIESVPMDMKTQDGLLRLWGVGVVLAFVSIKYRDKILAQTIIFALLLLFISAFPMQLPSKMRMPPHLSKGLALPLSVLIYDLSVVIFAYCFSLSVACWFKKQVNKSDWGCILSGKSLYGKINDCALWGLFVFTISQIVGSFGKLTQQGTYWEWNPMHLVFVSIWMLYAGMIHLKWVNGFSRRLLPALGVAGFVGIMGFRVIRML